MAFDTVYVQEPNGASYGPASLSQVAEWTRAGRVTRDAQIVDAATHERRPVHEFPAIVAAFPTTATDVFLPRNKLALVSYYVGIFSLIGACLGGVLGVLGGLAAIITGVMGLRYARQNPLAKGRVHAIVGIILGLIDLVLGGFVTAAAIAMIVAG